MNAKTVALYTENKYLLQKIKYDVYSFATVIQCDPSVRVESDLILWDNALGKCEIDGAVTLGCENADIPTPFPLGSILSLIQKEDARALTLDEENKTAILHGVRIRLTDVEFSLFLSLYTKQGEYVSRSELISSVWGESLDGGILNVYIHYLREKLEGRGEKIILSSRKLGYCIDKRFFGGEV